MGKRRLHKRGTYRRKGRAGILRTYAVCKTCRKEWNIPSETVLPKTGYECPKCEWKRKHGVE